MPQINKIIVTKLKKQHIEIVQKILQWYAIRMNDNIVYQVHDHNTDIIMSLATQLFYKMLSKTEKQYPPDNYKLNLVLHEAKLLLNALLEYEGMHGFNLYVEQLKTDIDPQIPKQPMYELIRTTSKDPQYIPQGH